MLKGWLCRRSFLPSSGDERRRKEADEILGYRLTLSTNGNLRLEAFAAKRFNMLSVPHRVFSPNSNVIELILTSVEFCNQKNEKISPTRLRRGQELP
ncbi:hypothetical protein YC2023_118452 [Brassica napus]